LAAFGRRADVPPLPGRSRELHYGLGLRRTIARHRSEDDGVGKSSLSTTLPSTRPGSAILLAALFSSSSATSCWSAARVRARRTSPSASYTPASAKAHVDRPGNALGPRAYNAGLFNLFNLVNKLEAEARNGNQGRDKAQLRRRQDDQGASRSAHPPRRDRRDRQRELALQERRLTRITRPYAQRRRGLFRRRGAIPLQCRLTAGSSTLPRGKVELSRRVSSPPYRPADNTSSLERRAMGPPALCRSPVRR